MTMSGPLPPRRALPPRRVKASRTGTSECETECDQWRAVFHLWSSEFSRSAPDVKRFLYNHDVSLPRSLYYASCAFALLHVIHPRRSRLVLWTTRERLILNNCPWSECFWSPLSSAVIAPTAMWESQAISSLRRCLHRKEKCAQGVGGSPSDSTRHAPITELRTKHQLSETATLTLTCAVGWEIRLAQRKQARKDTYAPGARFRGAPYASCSVEGGYGSANAIHALHEEIHNVTSAPPTVFSKSVLHEARTRLDAPIHPTTHPTLLRPLPRNDWLAADNELLKRDIAELQNMLGEAREEAREEVEKWRLWNEVGKDEGVAAATEVVVAYPTSKDIFTKLGTLRERMNEVVFDPAVACKIRKQVMKPGLSRQHQHQQDEQPVPDFREAPTEGIAEVGALDGAPEKDAEGNGNLLPVGVPTATSSSSTDASQPSIPPPKMVDRGFAAVQRTPLPAGALFGLLGDSGCRSPF
ncbi:hypothetical protein K439DRAFT_1656260 [Ramaria rubella]|nr:hypothetical protein K439DRAFT_1656260 [Ramaria rubella]